MSCKQILEALDAVMHEVTGVPKDGTNDFHRYKFVSEAGLVEHVRPALLKHGLFLIGPMVKDSPTVDSMGVTTFIVQYQLAHISGEVWPTPLSIVAQGCDRDSKGSYGDKGAYKAHTGAHKYLLLRLLNLVTGQEPEDDSPGQRVTREEAVARPARPKVRAPEPEVEVEAAGVPVGTTINNALAKQHGVYRAAFRVAELVHGKEKCNEDSKLKFSALDYGVRQLGYTKLSEVPVAMVATLKSAISSYGQVEEAGNDDEDIDF